MGKGDGGPAIS
jgi:hypothetical protein